MTRLSILLLFWILIKGATTNHNADPSETFVRKGKDAVLRCDMPKLDGMPPQVIQWFRGKVPVFIKTGMLQPATGAEFEGRTSIVDGRTNASLKIRNVTLEDEGTYSCKVIIYSPTLGKFEKPIVTDVHLVVTDPPSFVRTPPKVEVVNQADTLHLKCLATGRPEPVVTWYKDRKAVKNGENGILLSNGAYSELAVKSVTTRHRGNYTCDARSSEGRVTHTTMVKVKAPPEFTRRPSDVTIQEESTAMFECRASGYPSLVRYRWYYNGIDVKKSVHLSSRYKVLADASLMIYFVSASDKGNVTCVADNGIKPSPRATAFLTVQYQARVHTSKMKAHVNAGRGLRATLHCPADAEPPVDKVVWKRNGVIIAPHSGGRISLDASYSLVIEPAQYSDSGRYTCIPSNAIGTAGESTSTELDIRDPPYFTAKPAKVYEAELQKSIQIPCKGNGFPPPSVGWRKVRTTNEAIHYTVVYGNLSIEHVTRAVHGTWQCVLTNSIAEVTTNVEILVKYTMPHKVEYITAQQFSDSAIRVSWKPGYDGGYKQSFVIWYRQIGKKDPTWDTYEPASDHNATILNDLLPNTMYEIAVLPVNKIKSGPFSDTVTAKTRKSTPLYVKTNPVVPAPQALFASSTNGLVQLSWRKPGSHMYRDGRSTAQYVNAVPISSNVKILGFLVEYRWIAKVTREQTSGKRTKREVRYQHKPLPTQGKWSLLTSTYENITTVIIQPNHLYRDLNYEFRVFTASEEDYSRPSNPASFSTAGLTAYPRYKGPISIADSTDHPKIIGILFAVILPVMLIAFGLFCFCRRRAKKKAEKGVSYVTRSMANDSHAGALSSMNGKVIPNSHSIVVDLTEKGSGGIKNMDKQEYTVSDNAGDDDEVNTPFLRKTNLEEADKMFNAFIESHSSNTDNDSKKETLSSDRSSVRLRRETTLKVLSEQYKRRSLADHGMYRKLHKDMRLRGGTRSASTSPERSVHVKADDLNLSLPVDGKGRPRIQLYSRPIDEEGSAKQRRMIVIKRKSHKSSSSEMGKNNSVGAPPSDSSESPVFGVVGTLKRRSSPDFLEEASRESSSPVKRLSYSRPGRHRSPFDNDAFNRSRSCDITDDDVTKSPSVDSTKNTFEPVYSSSPKEFYSSPDVSPNRVKERRTVEYDPNESVMASFKSRSSTRNDPRWKKSKSLTHEQRAAFQPSRTRTDGHNKTYCSQGWVPNSPVVQHAISYDYERGHNIHYHSNAGYQSIVGGQPCSRYSLAPQESQGLQPSSSRHPYHPGPPVGGLHSAAARSRASYSFGHRQPFSVYSPNSFYEPHPQVTPTAFHSTNHSSHPSSSDQLAPQPTCEIDCSNSDIEVRFFKDAEGNEYSSILSPNQPGRGETVTSASIGFSPSTTATGIVTSALSLPGGEDVAMDRRDPSIAKTGNEMNRHNVSQGRVFSPTRQQRQRHSPSPALRAVSPRSNSALARPQHQNQVASPSFAPYKSNFTKGKPTDITPTSLPLATIGSSDYGSQDTSNSSTSPMPSSINHASAFSPAHLRFPAIPHERPPRKDNSSVEDNYEWDSEIAMESEILEALRHFGTLKKSGPVSDELLDELNKITKVTQSQSHDRQRAQSADILESHTGLDDDVIENQKDQTQMSSSGLNYSKESMARRCAALRAEFLHYQQLQQLDEDGVT